MIGCGGLGQFGIQYAKAMGLKVVGLERKDTVVSAAKVSTASKGDVNWSAFNLTNNPNL